MTIPFCVEDLAEFGADLDPDRKEIAPEKTDSSLTVIGTDCFKGTKNKFNGNKKVNIYQNWNSFYLFQENCNLLKRLCLQQQDSLSKHWHPAYSFLLMIVGGQLE